MTHPTADSLVSDLGSSFPARLSHILAPIRMGKISKFNFDAYAVIEATPAQSFSLLSLRFSSLTDYSLQSNKTRLSRARFSVLPDRSSQGSPRLSPLHLLFHPPRAWK